MNYKKILEYVLEGMAEDIKKANKLLEELDDCYSDASYVDKDNAACAINILDYWREKIIEKMEVK